MRQVLIIIIMILLSVRFLSSCVQRMNPQKYDQKPPPVQFVKVEGRELLVDYDKDGQYTPYFIKGVNYNPTPIGRYPNDLGWKDIEEGRIDNVFDDEERLRRDFALLKEMGCNTIRIIKANDTYRKGNNRFTFRMTKKTLDIAEKYGIKVIAGFEIKTRPSGCNKKKRTYRSPDFSKEGIRNRYKKKFAKFVKSFKNHPAILFWAIGNGNNEDIDPLNFERMESFYSMINEMALEAHKAEGKSFHPVAFVNDDIETIGDISFESDDNNMGDLDIWGANVFRGESFGNLFGDYMLRSQKPFWISEYGLDSWNSQDYKTPDAGEEDQETQAQWIGQLWDEIVDNKGTTIGATVMEYSDEWWRPDEKLKKGETSKTHDYFGIGPEDRNCDGKLDWYPAAPDQFFHSEWFGIVSLEDTVLDLDLVIPKKAYETLKTKFNEN